MNETNFEKTLEKLQKKNIFVAKVLQLRSRWWYWHNMNISKVSIVQTTFIRANKLYNILLIVLKLFPFYGKRKYLRSSILYFLQLCVHIFKLLLIFYLFTFLSLILHTLFRFYSTFTSTAHFVCSHSGIATFMVILLLWVQSRTSYSYQCKFIQKKLLLPQKIIQPYPHIYNTHAWTAYPHISLLFIVFPSEVKIFSLNSNNFNVNERAWR